MNGTSSLSTASLRATHNMMYMKSNVYRATLACATNAFLNRGSDGWNAVPELYVSPFPLREWSPLSMPGRAFLPLPARLRATSPGPARFALPIPYSPALPRIQSPPQYPAAQF